MISAIRNFSEVSFGSIMPQKAEPKKSSDVSQKQETEELNCDSSQKLLAKKTTIIPPRNFSMTRELEKHLPNIEADADLHHTYVAMYSYFKEGYARFDSKVNPKTLEILDSHIKSTNLSNFDYPYGTIGLSTTLDECITTDGLIQCSGVALVDKKHNLQTLVHVCPSIPNMNNAKLIRYILSFSKPEDLEIYIAPGKTEETDKTVEFIVDTIKNKNKDYKINFVNFPDNKNTTLVLRNGELACTTKENNHPTRINPKEKIINA